MAAGGDASSDLSDWSDSPPSLGCAALILDWQASCFGNVQSFMRNAVFMERDGVLNRVETRGKYPISPLTLEEFQLNREAVAPLRQLKAAGFLLIVTTNQPELSRGHLNRRELDRMHFLLKSTFQLDDILVCPHEEMDECPCRKPRHGMLTEAAHKWQLDLEQSFLIGVHWRDAQAAANAGCISLMLQSPWLGSVHHDLVLADLQSIADRIVEMRPLGCPQLIEA